MITFDRRKKDILSKKDKSSIGDVDPRIKELCDKINADNRYYTTSSCSGRIVLIRYSVDKKSGLFLFRTHEKISFEELKEKLESVKEKDLIIFKQEPCILAIACRSLEAATELLHKAREKSGWKESGIMNIGKRIMVELRSTEKLAQPIMDKSKILVDDDFIKILVKESNKRLERTWKKIENLVKII